MKQIKAFGLVMLSLALTLVYLALSNTWPTELKVPTIVLSLALTYLGIAGLLVKSNKTFKQYISSTLSAAWPF